jgi:DNA-directed RNA polymerase specialized sigma24 family protein
VSDGHTPADDKVVRFETTSWELVFSSADCLAPEHEKAFSQLCASYWYPLYTFARYRGFSEEDAEDLTQGFFLHVVEKKVLWHACPERGRFRSFLLASFQNYIRANLKRAWAEKRGGGHRPVVLDAEKDEPGVNAESVDTFTAAMMFDACWAKLLLERVTNRLSEEFCRSGKAAVFERLRKYLNLGGNQTEPSYRELAHSLGLTVSGAKTLVSRLRKRYGLFLRQEVALTLKDQRDVDAEIHSLYEALVAAEGRLER